MPDRPSGIPPESRAGAARRVPGVRALWMLLGLTATGCGLVGVILPGLPTTPFLLLAAFAFGRSSPRLEAWLLGHRRFGPLIDNWRRHGSIGRGTKAVAVLAMLAAFGSGLAFGMPGWALAVQAVALVGAGLFVLTRPSGPRS